MVLRLEEYALIGDTQTAALVGSDGSIDWLCLPRFDAGACFARLLGDEGNGRWSLAPAGVVTAVRRRYRGESLVLETEFTTPEGVVRVVDCMPPRRDDPDVVRVVEGVSGRVAMRCELVVRFGYGRSVPWVRRDGGVHLAVAGPDALVLDTPVALRGEGLTTVAEFTVAAGETVPFVLEWHPSHRVGFLPPRDERVLGTIAAVERELCEDGFVHRYTPGSSDVDGLPPGEGAFLACTFWLADAYALTGRRDRAVATFERLLDLRNDVGLLAEEYDPGARRQVGNFPQAFSHVPLVNTARNLSRGGGPAQRRQEEHDERVGWPGDVPASASRT